MEPPGLFLSMDNLLNAFPFDVFAPYCFICNLKKALKKGLNIYLQLLLSIDIIIFGCNPIYMELLQ